MVHTLRAELDAAHAELEAARAELRATREALTASEGVLETLRAELADVEAGRTRALAERTTMQRRLSAIAPAPEPVRLHDILTRRGLTADEHGDALFALLAEYTGPLVDALSLAGSDDLETLLDQRLVLTCTDCTLPDGAAAVTVAKPRCEVCGGSEVDRAFRSLLATCEAQGLRRLVIVGGSPVYRRELKRLAAPHAKTLRIDLVDGRSKPAKRRIRGLARNADRVLLWCSTIVDHATTEAFRAAGATCVWIPHRGIATMLDDAAAQLGQGVPDRG